MSFQPLPADIDEQARRVRDVASTYTVREVPLLPAVVSWAIFTVAYWIASLYKPFGVDEFYSWVYAERCTFGEIILLKDGGIGHPPLYHLLQKMVQTLFPGFHPAHVRIVNYLAGSVFVTCLVRYLLRFRVLPLFFYGLACSAALLNIFVFSRMWGLVCLAALLLLCTGERYVAEKTWRNAGLVVLVMLFGFLSDYNFILLFPYCMILWLAGRKRGDFGVRIFFGLLGLSFLGSPFLNAYLQGSGFSQAMYDLLRSIPKMFFEAGNLIFNFWFLEPFVVAWISVLAVCYLAAQSTSSDRDRRRADQWRVYRWSGIAVSFIVAEGFIRCSPLSFWVRYPAAFASLAVIPLLLRHTRNRLKMEPDTATRLVLHGVAGAMLLLLTFSPFFWRDLREVRFIIILLPFFIALMYRNFSESALRFISIVLLVSGILYMFSKGVGNYYPPPAFSAGPTTIYLNEFAYSTTYLKDRTARISEPLMFNFKAFEKYCRVCKMGNNQIPFDSLDEFQVAASDDSYLEKHVLPGFAIVGKEQVGLSRLDEFLFDHLIPIYPDKYALFRYRRTIFQ